MYYLIPEKLLRLAPQGHFLRGVYGTFYLAISVTFYETVINLLRSIAISYIFTT